jgi:hypothetical protein
MASREHLTFAALGELVECIGARRVEQPEARLGVARIRRDQRFCDQLHHVVDDLAFWVGRIGGDGAGGVEREAASKDRQATQNRLLDLGQQAIAKSHGRERPHPSLSPPRTDINTTGLDCPKPSPLAGDSPMYRPRQLVDFATPITTALMVHGFEASPQVARRQLLRL